MHDDQRPIAVFDSGLGGLTVVRELRRRLPAETIIYFGDTARLPYGTKTPETVRRFARENCALLQRMNPRCIVAACNTASAVCLPALADDLSVPVFGVVQPGAAAAVEATPSDGLIAVIATEATIASNAYKNAIVGMDARRAVVQLACPLFVPLVEEGLDARSPIVRLVIERYLGTLKRLAPAALVMGCTHYPMLRDAFASFFGEHVRLIDSARSTAAAVETNLRARGALSPARGAGKLHCYVSDNPTRFQTVGSRFLGEAIVDAVRACPEELAGAGAALRHTASRVPA